MVQELRNIERAVLPNGLVVISEEMQHIRSVSIGIWIKSGSRDEDPQWNGISHFVEHMVFKGTKHRSAEDIARQVDSIGGNMDAFTAKETICFNIKVLDDHLPIAMDVLSDLVLNPVFETKDITRERSVILEEIKMDEDNPDYLVHEIFTQNFWKDHPLGKPILGTKETVRRFEQPVIFDYWGQRFNPSNMIICAAGHLNHKQFVGLVAEKFQHLKSVQNGYHTSPPHINPRINMRNKNARERQGLVYAIYSDLNPYRDTGCLSIYAGTSKESAPKVVQSIVAELRKLKTELVPPDELRRAKDQLKGSLMLGLESSTSRMSNLARQEMYFDRFAGLDELIEKIEAVQAEDLKQIAEEFFRQELIAVTVLG